MKRAIAKWHELSARLKDALDSGDMALHEKLRIRFLRIYERLNRPPR